MAYTDRRSSDYGSSLGGSGSVGRLPGGHDDPLSLHQALQNAVDDQEQNQVCDENATTFMTDLPLLKSEYNVSPGERKGKQHDTQSDKTRAAIDEIISLDHKPETRCVALHFWLFFWDGT
jgi:hypothetical protein